MGAKVYETVIGLEVHIELATKTKLFCGCSTAFGGKPNTHTCPVCTGMPGALPVLNRRVPEYAAAVGLAMGCSIARVSRFDRKNYFYPDNPQNYQISQLYLPICQGGGITVETAAGTKRIGIFEIHMEEDAGKLFHEEGEDRTLIDYNRAGVPLLEIVSKPDMRSAEEVIAYLEELRRLIRYLGVSDCKLQEGSMRADVNLSVREAGTGTLGTRTEMKNLASFRAITKAIESERARQIALLEAGERVIQETRRFDEEKGISYAMRSKENAQDYRYFPEPDLPPVCLDDAFLEALRRRQPEFAAEKRKRYRTDFGLPERDIALITESKRMAELFEETVALGAEPKRVSNWLTGETLRLLKEKGAEPEEIRFSPDALFKLIGLTDRKEISNTVAKEIFAVMLEKGIDPQQYAEEKGLKISGDDAALEKTVTEVLLQNPQSVRDYRNGKEKAIGFLVGQTMKAMRGKADPVRVRVLLEKLLREHPDSEVR